MRFLRDKKTLHHAGEAAGVHWFDISSIILTGGEQSRRLKIRSTSSEIMQFYSPSVPHTELASRQVVLRVHQMVPPALGAVLSLADHQPAPERAGAQEGVPGHREPEGHSGRGG